MKKVLLLSLGLVMGLCAFAQETVVKSLPTPYNAVFKKNALGNDVVVVDGTANFEVRGTQSVVVNEGSNYYEASSMVTTYDLQSNSYLGNRMYQLKDGSVAVTSTMSRDEFDETFADRGTGYNFAKRGKVGKWGGYPQQRIEANATGNDVRTGWPSIAPYGAEGEILVNHANGLQYYVREKAGQGKWDGPHAIPNPENIDEVVKGEGNTLAWARIVTTGENNDVLHVFANASGDTNMAAYYLRTEDLQDWDIQFSPLEMDSLHINCYAADDYVVSANGDKIAVVYCAGFSQHVMLYESADAGKTWESRMVWECPVVELQDEWFDEENKDFAYKGLYGPTHASVAIGNDGVSHVALGVSMYDLNPGGYYSLYYGMLCDGIAYWNDTTCWETEIKLVVDKLTPTDTLEEFEYGIDTLENVNADTIFNYLISDSTLVVDTTSVVIDSVALDTTYVVDSTYTYIYDTTVVVDTTFVYDTTYSYVTDSTVVVDTTYTYLYDTTWVNDTVGVPSPIRSVYDDSLKHALRMWTPDPEDETSMFLDFTNFCAMTPPHPEQGFNYFEAAKQYTGSEDAAGDYLMSFGVSAYPAIAVDPAGNLALAYSAPDVLREWNGVFYYRTIFVNYKPVDSLYWGQTPVLAPTNLYDNFIHASDEATFVSAVSNPVNENEFWFSCLSDDTPGFYNASAGASQANITSSTVHVFKFNPDGNLNDKDEEIGVEETVDVVYNIFPNPASEYIVIGSSMDANATVTFSNIAGQTVKVVNANLATGNNTIAVSDLTSGVYFCTVTANGYSHTSKVVIK